MRERGAGNEEGAVPAGGAGSGEGPPVPPDVSVPGAAPARPAAAPAARAQLAREALLAAKADSAARGNWPGQHARHSSGAPARPAGPRRRRDDPEALDAAIAELIDARGWRLAAAAGSVFGRWEQIVGPELAAHTRPDGFADGELTVTADSTAWATQVRLLAAALVRRVNAELGDGAVTRVKVRGPAAPRQPGQWRVRDSRGPRDTYG